MRAASKARTSRFVRLFEEPTDRCGQARPATAFAPHHARPPGPARARRAPATHVEQFGTAQGLPVGGAFVIDVKGTPLFIGRRPGPAGAPLQRGHATLRARHGARPRRRHQPLRQRRVRRQRPAGTRLPESWARDGDGRSRSPTAPGPSTSSCSRGSAPRRSAGFPSMATSSGCSSRTAGSCGTTRRRRWRRRRRAGADPAHRRQPRDQPMYAGDTPLPANTTFEAAANSLRFEFALPTHFDESATEYQSRLDGFDADWSAVDARGASATTRTSGSATIASASARAASAARSATRPSYAFTILPPWYRTWWAYGGYIALLGAAGLRRATALQRAARRRPRSASARSSPKRSCAPRPPRRWRAPRARARRTSSCSARWAARSPSSLDFDTIFGKLYERVNQLADADVFGVGLYHPEQTARSSTAWRSRRASATRRTRATRPTATSCRSGASSTASRCSSTTSPTEYRSYISTLRRARASRSKTARCRSSRSRSSTCRSSPRTACSASSRSRASRRTPTPSTTST